MPLDFLFYTRFLDVVSIGASLIMGLAGFAMGRIYFSRYMATTAGTIARLWARFISGVAFFSFMFFERLIESPTTAYRWFGGLLLWTIFIVFISLGEQPSGGDNNEK